MGILGENGALQLIECLTWSVSFDVFMDNISHLFICLSTLKLTTLEQHLRSTKICYANALSLGTNGCKKRNVATLNSANQAKKQCNFDSGWLEWQQWDFYSFFWILWTEEICSLLEQSWKKYIQEQQPNQFHCCNHNMGFVTRMDQDVAKYYYPKEKMVVVPVCLNGRCCYSCCVGVVLY